MSQPERMALAAQQGDRQAADWIYRHYHRRIKMLMRRMVGHQDADDVSQQCFLALLRRIGGFAGRSSFWTWFYQLAVNEALQHLRRKHQRPFLTTADQEAWVSPETESVEDREAYEHALGRLPDSQRLTLKLHYEQGLSYKDISSRLAIPMGTVGSRINQAKSQMAQIIRCDSAPAGASLPQRHAA